MLVTYRIDITEDKIFCHVMTLTLLIDLIMRFYKILMGSVSRFVDASGPLWGDFGPPYGTHSRIEVCSGEA